MGIVAQKISKKNDPKKGGTVHRMNGGIVETENHQKAVEKVKELLSQFQPNMTGDISILVENGKASKINIEIDDDLIDGRNEVCCSQPAKNRLETSLLDALANTSFGRVIVLIANGVPINVKRKINLRILL